VYRIVIGTKVHVSRSALCDQRFVHLFPELRIWSNSHGSGASRW